MKIRGGHIAVLATGALFAFVVLSVLNAPPPDVEPPPAAGEGQTIIPKFLENQMNAAEEARKRANEGVGTLPPVDAPPDWVASIQLETDRMDAGIIPNDDVTHRNLMVKNTGKAVLKISKINTSCPCTMGYIDDGYIQPGEEKAIDVVIDPSRVNGFRWTKTLTIYSNDPNRGAISVDVSAQVEPEVELVPEEIHFGKVEKGDTPSFGMIVRQSAPEPPLLIQEVTVLDRLLAERVLDDISVQVEQRPKEQWLDPAKTEYLFHVTLGPAISPGPFTRRFSFKTNMPRISEMAMLVPVEGEIVAPYSMDTTFPKPLLLQPSEDGKNKGTLTITGDSVVEITNIEVEPALVSAEARSDAAAKQAYVDVVSLPGAPAGRLEAELRFTVNIDGHAYVERVGVLRTFQGTASTSAPSKAS